MTREEAIKWIRLDIDMAKFDPSTGEDAYLNDDAKKVIEAQKMAIKALEQPDPCEDAVSREAVSEWLKQYGQDVLHGKYKFSLMYIWKKLMELPSVTPKTAECEDAVSRSGAIIQLSHNKIGDDDCDAVIQRDIETIKRLPSVVPKRKNAEKPKMEEQDANTHT